jgi:hypothetical protein
MNDSDRAAIWAVGGLWFSDYIVLELKFNNFKKILGRAFPAEGDAGHNAAQRPPPSRRAFMQFPHISLEGIRLVSTQPSANNALR